MWNEDTDTLVRRYRAGHAEIDGYAEDYAFLIFGLLELFQADPDPNGSRGRSRCSAARTSCSGTRPTRGWFSTTGRDPNVLLRMKEDYDGAEPTASSVSVLNLLVLSHLIEDRHWTEQIDRTLGLFGQRLEQMGRAVPMMAAALSASTAGLQQIVIVGEGASAMALERCAALRYLPFALTLALTPAQQAALAPLVPLVAAMRPVEGQARAFVCRDFTCRPPVTTAADLERELR